MFNIGLGIHKGVTVYILLLLRFLRQRQAIVCFSSTSAPAGRWWRARACGNDVLPGLRHASCNYLVHKHTQLFFLSLSICFSLSQTQESLTSPKR